MTVVESLGHFGGDEDELVLYIKIIKSNTTVTMQHNYKNIFIKTKLAQAQNGGLSILWVNFVPLLV